MKASNCGKMLAAAVSAVAVMAAACFAQTPVEKHGQLKVVGSQVLDKNNAPVQLRGMSLYWSIAPNARDFYNADVVKYIRDEWNATLIRAAMGVEDKWGSGNDQAGYVNGNNSGGVQNEVRVTRVVEGAIEHGMYVIIDWHSHYADEYRQQSIEFFQGMARTYKDYPNVIYEIFNEPKEQVWATTIKPYAQAVVDAIRAIDPNNLILIGTRQWCQQPLESASNPVDGENLAYVMHFYAASHKESLRTNTFRALRQNKAIFVSEFGIGSADGNGQPDIESSNMWMDFMDQFKLSWANWSLSTVSEISAALKSGASTTPGVGGVNWGDNNLTTSGLYISNRLKTPPSTEKSFYTLTVDVVGSGNVYQGTAGTGDPNQIYYKGANNANVTLRAVPSAQGGWTFTGWNVNGEDKGSTSTIQVAAGGSADVAVTATFTSSTSAIQTAPLVSRAKRFGISQNGANLRIVGTSQETPIRIYNLNGKLLMSRSAMPNEVISVSNLARGTYVVKALGNSVRIVR